MKVQPINNSIIVSTSRKSNISFGKDSSVKKDVIDNKPVSVNNNKTADKSEKRYNTIGVIVGASTLALLGLVLVNIESGMRFFRSGKRNLKGYLAPNVTIRNIMPGAHSGPSFNPMIGPDYIEKGWTEYIQGINKRIKSHKKVEKIYNELFTKEGDKLKELESLAKQRVLNRGGQWV